MKLIIAGSRGLSPSPKKIHGYLGDMFAWLDDRFTAPPYVCRYQDLAGLTLEVVSGAARGVDKAGEDYVTWAREQFPGTFTVTQFPANWDKYGKVAGHLRNRQMAEYADAALLIWDGSSSGTANMAIQMLALDKPVRVITLDPH